eukprot:7185147-Alexandrium_andersonii.AAC.1
MRREPSAVVNPHAANGKGGVGQGKNIVPASPERTLLGEAGIHPRPREGEGGGTDIHPSTLLDPMHGLSEIRQIRAKVPDHEVRSSLEVRNLNATRPEHGIRPRGAVRATMPVHPPVDAED